MGITIQARGRASKFHDLATLKITHAKGTMETPNRVVTKNDSNAKDNLGADIPLTRSAKAFIIQENIDPTKLQNILTINGYMATILSDTNPWKGRVGNPESLIFLYPSLTEEATKKLIDAKQKKEFIRFFIDVAKEMGLESVVLPAIMDLNEMRDMAKAKNLQLIPVLNLSEKEKTVFENQYNQCKAIGESDIPIIALRFTPYPKANLAYNTIMDDLDKLHEKHQATMLVNLQRNLRGSGYMNVSAPHYGSLIIGDILAETYYHGGGGGSDKTKSVTLFCRKDLVALSSDPRKSQLGRKFDLDEEKQVFSNDKKLQELLERIVENSTTPNDWKNNRPSYLSRVHENVRTRGEFDMFQKNIDADTTSEYLSEKKDMNTVITNQLKDRVGKKES